jgi:hypothetical protein
VLIGRCRLQRDAQSLGARGVAVRREADAGEADAGVVPFADQARQEIQRAVAPTRDAGVERAPRLLGARGVRLHHQPEPLQLEGDDARRRGRLRHVIAHWCTCHVPGS